MGAISPVQGTVAAGAQNLWTGSTIPRFYAFNLDDPTGSNVGTAAGTMILSTTDVEGDYGYSGSEELYTVIDQAAVVFDGIYRCIPLDLQCFLSEWWEGSYSMDYYASAAGMQYTLWLYY